MIIVHLLVDIIILIILFYLFILSLSASHSIGLNMFAVERLFNSWKKKPISLIKASNTIKCSNQQMEDLISYTWPGTWEGCDCTEISKGFFTSLNDYFEYSGNLYSGSCNWNMTMVGCSYIKPLESKTVHKWRNNYLCASFMKERYFDLEKSKSECSQGYKSCGIIDTINNHLCVKESDPCPINEFTIKPGDYDNLLIQLSNNNKENGRVITDIQVSDGKLCLHSDNEDNFYEKDYELMRSSSEKNGCISYTSSMDKLKLIYFDESIRYVKLDEYPKKSFYVHNSIQNMISNFLPKYPKLKDININLYLGNYIGWKKECTKITNNNLKSSDLNNLESDISTHISSIKSSIEWISFLLFIIFIGLLILFFCYKYSGNTRDEFSRPNTAWLVIVYIITFILCLTIHNLAERNRRMVKNIDEREEIDSKNISLTHRFIEVITNKDCSDELTNLTLRNFFECYSGNIETYEKISFHSNVLIFLCVLLCLVSIYPLLNYHFKERIPYVNQEVIEGKNIIGNEEEYEQVQIDKNDAASPAANISDHKQIQNSQDLPTLDELEKLNK